MSRVRHEKNVKKSVEIQFWDQNCNVKNSMADTQDFMPSSGTLNEKKLPGPISK